MADGEIRIRPGFDAAQLRPFGLRVHLAAAALAPVRQTVDLRNPGDVAELYRRVDLSSEPLRLRPGEMALGSTVETVEVGPNLLCRLDGRSTLARLGLLIHCGAATIDGVSWREENVVLELCNVGGFDLMLPGGYPIAMLVFERADAAASEETRQKQYSDQRQALGADLSWVPVRPAYLPGAR